MRRLLAFLTLLLLCSSCGGDLRIVSPNKKLSLELGVENGELCYYMWRGSELLLDRSVISITTDSEVSIVDYQTSRHDEIWEPVWGQFSQIRDQHNQLEINILLGEREAKLFVRMFNDGVAFRYQIEDYDNAEQAQFNCSYNLRDSDMLYYTAGERAPIGPLELGNLPDDVKSGKSDMKLPLYIQRDDDCVIAMIESDLFSAKGFSAMQCAYNIESEMLETTNNVDYPDEELLDGALITPWRVILVGSAEDLITSTTALNLAAPSQNEDFEWLQPGKTLWDWRVHGYVAPDGFKYGVDTESYIRFIDFAAQNDIEYFLIDDDWYDKVTPGKIDHSKKLDLDQIIEHAQLKGVKLILYYDRKKGVYGDEELFDYYRSLDMYGIKYGFMYNNAEFTRNAIELSAQSNLLIDFHDAPVPMTGVERTSPNAISREYCHAQQDSRRAFTPEAFIKMAMINSLQGPLDMNNGNFDIVGINSGERQKSPRIPHSYLTTVVSEMARTLIIHSGLVCIPDAPEAYSAKMDLFDFIKMMPVGEWDESIVLGAKMGEHITTARRCGDDWFIGSVIDTKGGVLPIALDLLDEEVEYIATLYEDGSNADCKSNPESYEVRKISVKQGDVIDAVLAPGGGHCIYITPKEAF